MEQRTRNTLTAAGRAIETGNDKRKESIMRWQDRLCSAARVYAACYSPAGDSITEFSGNTVDVMRLRGLISNKRISSICSRVSESAIEYQAVEATDAPNVKLAAISIRGDRKEPLAVWIMIAVLNDIVQTEEFYHEKPVTECEYKLGSDSFVRVMDLVRCTLSVFLKLESRRTNALIETRESKITQAKTSEMFRKAEAMTEIVSQLDKNEPIEEIMACIMNYIGEYLGVSHGFICKMHRNDNLTDIIVQWESEESKRLFAKETNNIERFWFLKGTNPVVLSYDAGMTAGQKKELEDIGIKAIAVFPISIAREDDIGFYVCLAENKTERVWSVDDIKFISDSVKILQSIIARRIQKNSLASSFASLEAILDNVGSSIYVRDIHTGILLFVNRSLRSHFSKELRDGTLEKLFTDSGHGETSGNREVYYSDRKRWYDLYYTHIKWVDGSLVSLYAIYDVTEKKVYQKKIEQQAYTDFLTGLYNRMCCERDLDSYIADAQRNNLKGEVLYLDLDDFKHINDGLGHQYGDILLKDISNAMRHIDGIHNTCYRMGGDEFVIIIPASCYGLRDKIIKSIKDIFAKSWFLKDADYYCTMSMGIVEFPTAGNNVADLIKKADISMYEAKKAGKNRIARYSDSINSTSGRRLDMEKNMRDAMLRDCDEFEIFYQPIIDTTQNSECSGAEALVRWNSKMGFISPGEFIPLAEYLGLINPIGNHVLFEACKVCKYWNDNNHPTYRVNVNLSVVQLLQPDVIDIIRKAIEESGLTPSHLVLEITESLAINDLDRTKDILMQLKKMGIKVALDDFGTGYSSLNNIRALPFDIIKVDQNFVRDLAEDSYSQSFIKMISELGSAIGADICVEGIETDRQNQVLESMKVRYIQGYYYDKPLPRDEFEAKYITGKRIPNKKITRSMDI